MNHRGHYSWLHHERRVLDHEFPKKSPALAAPQTTGPAGYAAAVAAAAGNNKCALVLYFLIK